MNRLENKSLGRELSKHRVQDKRMGTGNERVHLGSGLALRSNLREAGQIPCYSSALNYFDIIAPEYTWVISNPREEFGHCIQGV
jgi:hypothetical protein